MKELYFRYCDKCSGILSINNQCTICDGLENSAAVESSEILLPTSNRIEKSFKNENGNNNYFPTISGSSMNVKSQLKNLENSHFLRIEESEPIIWHPCPLCEGKYREIAVLTNTFKEKVELFGVICSHSYKDYLPSEIVIELEKALEIRT